MSKPQLSKAAIWNMSVGFLGIQMGFSLQNSNASRILQTFGADTHSLSWFWLVAPITGMVVQPIIGAMSDATWSERWGRRKPFFLIGGILSAIGLIMMPNAAVLSAIIPALWVGAGMLMIMDASFNVAMEPFRALVADKLPETQRTEGFTAQTALIGIGAVIGSWLPYFLINWFGIGKDAAPNTIPMNVIISFVFGAIVLVAAVLWSIKTTPEYSPAQLKAFGESQEEDHKSSSFIQDVTNMPKTMAQLGLVQFFSWFALFCMWVFTTPAIAHKAFGLPLTDSSSAEYQAAGDWTGIIFGVYNGVSALIAFFVLPKIAELWGRRNTHMFSLILGGLGLISMFFITNKWMLIASMVGVGIAWASILAMPYAMLAGAIPLRKMGVYMGIFNLFITIPQIVSGVINKPLMETLYNGNATYALLVGGICMIIGGLLTTFVEDKDDPYYLKNG